LRLQHKGAEGDARQNLPLLSQQRIAGGHAEGDEQLRLAQLQAIDDRQPGQGSRQVDQAQAAGARRREIPGPNEGG